MSRVKSKMTAVLGLIVCGLLMLCSCAEGQRNSLRTIGGRYVLPDSFLQSLVRRILANPRFKTLPTSESCKPGEVFSKCGTCDYTCTTYGTDIGCANECTVGCFCQEGSVRDNNDACIPYKNCPRDTGPPQPNCYENPETGPCEALFTRYYFNPQTNTCEEFTYGGCQGNGNNYDTREQCLATCIGNCGEGEEYSECGTCEKTCDNYDKNNICTRECRIGCFCKAGFVRKNKRCVPISECGRPATTCRRNEVFKECGTACPTTCDNYGALIKCTANCVTGCFCKDGLVRTDKGRCILPKFCPKKSCQQGEVFSVCGTCDYTCTTYGTDIGCANECTVGCFCPKGSVRDNNNACIPISQCPRNTGPPQPNCYESPDTGSCYALITRYYFNPQTNTCEEFTYGGCQGNGNNYDTREQCLATCIGPPQPNCYESPKTGPCKALFKKYYFNPQTNTCEEFIYGGCQGNGNNYDTREQCLATCRGPCPENEGLTDCVTPCKDCKYYKTGCPIKVACKIGCDCKDGYYRNNGKCIPQDQCPSRQCGINEEPGCEEPPGCLTCNNPIHCPTFVCNKGCVCKSGHLRNDFGICVPQDLCPCGANEEISHCVSDCNTCRERGTCQSVECRFGCDCKKNFFRNDAGRCVPYFLCPNTCPENEEFTDCVTPCKDCTYYKTGCPIKVTCKEGCDCKDGYYRNDGKCIPQDECPISCGENAVYQYCGTACPQTCDTYATPVFCTLECVLGCFCVHGYVRAPNGSCVKPHECLIGNCPENENPTSCVHPCKNCANRGHCYSNIPCHHGCDCIDGFYRNDSGSCVPEDQCPKSPCEPYEEYQYGRTACPETCDNYGQNLVCTEQGVDGCFCRKGTVRTSDGRCVWPRDCYPSHLTSKCGVNEEYQPCGSPCSRTCGNLAQLAPEYCKLDCVPGCYCKDGLLRDNDGSCVVPWMCKPSWG